MIIIEAFTAIVIHLLGHLLTGLALVQRPKLFFVGFLGIRDEESGQKLFFNNLCHIIWGSCNRIQIRRIHIPKVIFKILIAGPMALADVGLAMQSKFRRQDLKHF